MAKKLKMNALAADTAPTLRLTSSQLPEIKDWEVSKKYDVVVSVTMKSKKEGNEYDWQEKMPKGEVEAVFKIDSVGVEEADPPAPMSYGQEYASQMSKKSM